RRVGFRKQFDDKAVTMFARHAQVTHDHIVILGGLILRGLLTVACDVAGDTFARQRALNELPHVGVVVHHEHPAIGTLGHALALCWVFAPRLWLTGRSYP